MKLNLKQQALTSALAATLSPITWAQQAPSPDPAPEPAALSTLERVEIASRHYNNAVGTSDAASQGTIQAALLKSRPAQRPGEVLEFVPGMMVTQHSGDGKANQYFLRGFNLDHGVDFATSVDGLPVNMLSHAHGQGYADLNFLIPELVQRIEYRKGPYFAKTGDLSTAGSADIQYQRKLDAPFLQLSLGGDNYRRLVAAGSTELAGQRQLLGAVELSGNDGPWVVPEGLKKRSAVLSLADDAAGWAVGAQSYGAHWTATNQVPQRLIDAGSYEGKPFGRFDSLDASDGGLTSRHSLWGAWKQADDQGGSEARVYWLSYRLALWSDHTFAMDRPATTDQALQQDRRQVLGISASRAWEQQIADLPLRTELGVQLRHDSVELGLYDTQARRIVGTTREDQVRQLNLGLWAQAQLEATPWARLLVGLRADRVGFEVDSKRQAANSGSGHAQQLSPKASLVLGPWARTEFFINAGRGFHSNDARGTTARVDPRTGAPVEAVPGLAATRGSELGLRTEAIANLQSSLALWQLALGSEQVYIGDSGVTEPHGPSQRHGVEWNNRWTPLPWLLFDADLAWSHARFVGVADDRIPNAVDKVASIAVSVKDRGPWSASLQWRYLGASALLEDNSQRSRPSATLNARLSRQLGQGGRFGELTLDVFNLANRKVNDIEYFYESQLPGEAAPVADRHVHAAEPRSLRLSWRISL